MSRWRAWKARVESLEGQVHKLSKKKQKEEGSMKSTDFPRAKPAASRFQMVPSAHYGQARV